MSDDRYVIKNQDGLVAECGEDEIQSKLAKEFMDNGEKDNYIHVFLNDQKIRIYVFDDSDYGYGWVRTF